MPRESPISPRMSLLVPLPLLLLPERVAPAVQVHDEAMGNLIRHLWAVLLTHYASGREIRGSDLA